MTLTVRNKSASPKTFIQRRLHGVSLSLFACATALAVGVPLWAQPTLPAGSIAPYPGSRSEAELVRPVEYRADVFGWVALGRVLWSSGFDQTVQSPEVWPRTPESYGRRLLTRSAQLVAIESVRHGVAAALQRDPAYVKCSCQGFGPRMGQVFKAVVTDFDMDGTRRIGWPRFAGALAGSMVLGQLQPGQGSAETVAFRALTTVGGSIIGNSMKEFAVWESLTGAKKDL